MKAEWPFREGEVSPWGVCGPPGDGRAAPCPEAALIANAEVCQEWVACVPESVKVLPATGMNCQS